MEKFLNFVNELMSRALLDLTRGFAVNEITIKDEMIMKF